ncbi:MAG: polyprenyl synthetase family protein [Gammaproteobacteria bacterium]|jgi:octaprenyl-diphosphate synthase
MELSEIRALLQPELDAMDKLIYQRACPQLELVNSLTDHVATAGGKRLRPIVLILIAKAFEYPGQNHITLAAATELVHTASLLHDDVVDESTMRRGIATANEIWGNTASVLVGDFLYSRAGELVISLEMIPVVKAFASSTHLLTQGEIMQLMHRSNFDMRLQDYLDIITHKTGRLFELSGELAALLASPTHVHTAKTYGLNLGIAFQMMDDILDYQGESKNIGKNIGDDLRDGNLTLPLLYILQNGSNEQKNTVKQAFLNKDIDALQQVIMTSDSIQHTQQMAHEYMHNALNALNDFPKNSYTDALAAIAQFSIKRNH